MRKAVLGLLAGLLMLMAACAEEVKPKPLLRIADVEYSVEDFINYLAATHPEIKLPVHPEVLNAFLKEFEERKLLAYGAAKAGVVPPREADSEITRENGAIARYLTEEAGKTGALEVSEESIQEIYQQRYGERRVNLRSIFISDEATASRVHSNLRRNPNRFEQYMREYNNERAIAEGIGQGVMTRQNMPDWLSEKVFALREGRVSELINFGEGYLIVQVIEFLPPRPLEEVRGFIQDELAAVRREEVRRDVASNLRDNLEVEFNPQLAVETLLGAGGAEKDKRQQ
jgi:parvulin-like peptidyl-prolyl isomerase